MKIKFLLLLIVMCSCENKPQTFLDLFSNSISIRLHLYRQVRLVPVLQKLLLAQ